MTRLTKQLSFIISLLLPPQAAIRAADSAKPSTKPNVVLIISDDQGARDYSFMGHPHIQTPHIDKLAAESLTFPRGFVPTSVCCPSLASIITGLYPHQHRITANDPPLPKAANAKLKGGRGSTLELTERWNAMLDGVPTLPRLLASHDYLSFQTGKWWQGNFARGGFTHGMTEGSRHGDKGLTIGREGLQPIYDFITESRNQKKPFLVWYAPFMPHSPHTPPQRLLAKYSDKTDSPHLARYWAMCDWFDETCGELLGYLDREKLADNTIVIYVTDNGWIQSPSSPNFAPKNKTTPYDAGHRTPVMVRWPGRVAPAKSTALASSIDIAPTLLAALGVNAPKDLRGVDLLDTQAVQSRQYVFGEDFTIRSQTLDDPAANILWRWVTDGRWRLVLPRTFEAEGALKTIPSDKFLIPDLEATLQSAQPMLYDLEADPSEENNIASTQQEIVAKLRMKLDAHWTPHLASP
jgi:arylsulfatase A-like enzyme